MDVIHTLANTLLVRLAWTSAQAVLLIGALWLLGRWMPRLSPAIRCMLWWVLSVQLIAGLVLGKQVELPLLSPAPLPSTAAMVASYRITPLPSLAESTTPRMAVTSLPPSYRTMPIASSTASTPSSSAFHGRSLLMTLWLAGLLVQWLLVARQWRAARRVLHESTPLHDETLQAQCTQQARLLGLRRCPRLRVSRAIASPQVTGLWRATVLLPASQVLTPDEASMALAHELAHLRRGDLWLGCLPAIAQRLFFFHPLVRWAMREYALHREAACDAQVLQQHRAAPQDYGRLLLRLGVAQPMRSGLAGASPTFQNLKRRLTMLQHTVNRPQWRTQGWLVVLIALAGVLPYRVTATHAANADVAQGAASGAERAPVMEATTPRHTSGVQAHHVDIETRSDASDGFALFDGDSVTNYGTNSDLAAAERLHQSNGPMLWFRRGDETYLIRDKDYIQRAKAAYAPVVALARQQGELGERQGQLGGKQGELGARQGELGARQAQLASQQASLAASSLGDATAAGLEAQRTALEASQNELRRQQAELGREQTALGKQQGALGAQQQALGKRQQQATEQANRHIGKLLDEAIKRGAAQKLSMNAFPSMPAPPAPPAPPPVPVVPPPTPPVAPPPPPTIATTTSSSPTRAHDSDITTADPGSYYAYALYDRHALSETEHVNGDRNDVAAAQRLHATDATPMFWFRRGSHAYLIRDVGYVERARAIYAPVTAYWRDAGRLEGEQWRRKGPLQGLQAWQRSVEDQRRELLADRQAPAATQRLASLDAQQREIAARKADLEKQLAALQPQLDAQARRQQQVIAQADQQASLLIDEALANGAAQRVSAR